MPSKVRIITRKSREEIDLDRNSLHVLQQLWNQGMRDKDATHFGIQDYETADALRKSYRRVGRKVKPEGIAVRAFWQTCDNGCEQGGESCRYHVVFSLHDMEDARRYMAEKRKYAAGRLVN